MNYQSIDRVFTWNEKRYDREFNLDLTMNLLTEEWQEWMTSGSAVDTLDALLDIMFVAYGAIWKLDEDYETMQQEQDYAVDTVNRLIQIDGIFPGYVIQSFMVSVASERNTMHDLLVIAMLAVMETGLTPELADKAFNIVCDSNDSKTITKTLSSVKANTDKGPYFVAPEARLQEILNAALN